MKRLATGLALIVTAVVATAGLAAPAQAGAPGYTKQGTYGWNDQCLGVGYLGQTNGSWTNYYCAAIIPASWSGPGLYELWVQ